MTDRARAWSNLDATARAQFWATLALRHSQGIGPRTWNRLLQSFGSAYAAVSALSDWPALGIPPETLHQVASGAWRSSALEEWNAAQSLDAHILLWHDALYPARLRQLPDAPALLYCCGDLALLEGPSVAVVGSRDCTAEGVRVAGTIARQLASAGVTIISGMALGIDNIAHTAALRGVGRSIGVLGTGIDVLYPAKNAALRDAMMESGLVLTEFAPGTKPLAANFPVRNRIISGLALGVLVVEAALRSGSLITARLALEQNREVYAIPGPASMAASLGCQELIRQGARPVFNAEDILRDLAPQLAQFGIEQTSTVAYSANETGSLRTEPTVSIGAQASRKDDLCEAFGKDAVNILAALKEKSDAHVECLCACTGIPASKVNSILIELEVEGRVKRLPGARYVALG